jgi:hypothetical protein
MSEPEKKEDILSVDYPNWIAIAPGLFVQKEMYELRKYYDARKEASRKYMESLQADEDARNGGRPAYQT